MTTAPTPIRSDDVAVADGVVRIRDLVETDPDAVRVVTDADDVLTALAGELGAD